MSKKIKSIKIKQLREEKGWTQTYLATAAGVERSTIIRMESGKKKYFSLETIKSVASAFDIDFSNLIEIDDVIANSDLTKLNHGKTMDNLSFGKNGSDFDYDISIINPDLLEEIYDLFDFVECHIEKQLKWSQRMTASEIIDINNLISTLAKNNLFIYVGELVVKLETDNIFNDINFLKIWVGNEMNKIITKDDLKNPFISEIGPN